MRSAVPCQTDKAGQARTAGETARTRSPHSVDDFLAPYFIIDIADPTSRAAPKGKPAKIATPAKISG